jgi:hypothetical protein
MYMQIIYLYTRIIQIVVVKNLCTAVSSEITVDRGLHIVYTILYESPRIYLEGTSRNAVVRLVFRIVSVRSETHDSTISTVVGKEHRVTEIS